MTPHALRLSAFGAFADTVTVDLDQLSTAGLFLLHGPTGGGKSTLLDAIGFALYGRVPGARNAAKRLRSDYASASVPTEVCLEATFGGRRIRITRAPAYDRPKVRGNGTTPSPARVLLEELIAGRWETLSSRPREADDEVLDLVGMSAEQFFQVVLLPQGEFAQFLRASSVDRAALLQKLFSLERFAAVEDWLAGRRRVCASAAEAQQVVVDSVLARVVEVSGSPCSSVVEAASALTLARASEASAAEGVAAAVVARDACRADADAAVALASVQERRRLAVSRSLALKSSRPERLALQAEWSAAGRAAEVAAVLAAAMRRRSVRDKALETFALQSAGFPDASADELRGLAAAAVARVAALEALSHVDAERRAAVELADRARSEQADALAAASGAELELAVLPVRRAEVAEHLAVSRAAALSLPGLSAERAGLIEVRPELIAWDRVSASIVAVREQVLTARETALALKTKAHELAVASVNSMVARLAVHLEDGIPCEVCGSPSHPDPSELRDEGVSVEDERRARALAEDAELVAAGEQSRLAALQVELAALSERVGAWTMPLLDERLAELDLSLAVVAVQAAQLDARELDLSALESRRTELVKDCVAASSRAEFAGRRVAEALERAGRLSAELAAAGAANLAPALAEASRLQVQLDEAASAAEALALAQRELSEALATSEIACAAAGFATAEDAALAQREVAWRASAEAQLRAALDLEAAVAAELADPALDVPLATAAPVEETAAALAAADVLLGSAHEELGTRQQRRVALERLVPELTAALGALEPLVARADEVRALADLCAGQGANGLKMTLASFVLAARLEEVAEAATVRLLRMTQGRYELIHTDGAARGGVRSGLGLLVRDSWSGQDRDTATLSGGETFLASLALALGLADVVTAEAGGSRIGALFVDEGFGMLDEETLDEVMDVLDGLREGGRMVGLVSHVAELRQRIPVRLEVLKGRSGSAVAVHGC